MKIKSFMRKSLCIFLSLFFTGQAFSAIYYVSATGNDMNSGTSSSTPWQTISKVNSMMSSFNGGDQILFKRGDKFYGMVTLTKSGLSGNPILFGSYGSGALPVITGKKQITGWTVHSGSIYKATVADTVGHLMISNKLMTIARYPNSGFLRIDVPNSNNGFYDAALGQAPGYFNGANVKVRTVNWTYEIRRVSNFSGGNITYASPTVYTPTANFGYYIDNKLTLLDTQNEWYYDAATTTLYFYAPGGANPNTLNVEAFLMQSAFKSNLHVHNIQIQEIEMNGYRNNGIDSYSSSNHTYQDCRFINTSVYAIQINGANNIIQNNFFEDNFNSCVMGVMSNSLVKGNLINRTGLYPGYGKSGWGYVALETNFSTNTIVENNVIDSSGYSGICAAKNLIVRNNVIDYSCLVLNDGGGVDITNCDTLLVENNIIGNTVGNFESSAVPVSYCCGIYINGAVMKNSTIRNNTVYGSRFAGINVDHNNPVNNKFIGNTLYNNFQSQLMMSDFSAGTYHPSYNTVYKHNILYSLQSTQNGLEQRMHTSTSFSDFGLFDSNYYCNPYSQYVIKKWTVLPPYTTLNYTLTNWQATGEDPNSVSPSYSFDQYMITDTLSPNLITNSQFSSNTDPWGAFPSAGANIASVDHPQLDGNSMRVRWKNIGYSQAVIFSNNFPVTKGSTYLMSLSVVGNHPGTFHVWGLSSISSSYFIHPQIFLPYDNVRKNHSFTFKADTNDAAARTSINMIWPDSLLYVDNVNIYKVAVEKIDSTQMSKLFINPTASTSSQSLNGITYKDLDGNVVTGSITLQPFSSKILINENVANAPKALNLTALFEGFYNQVTGMMIPDTALVQIRNASAPFNIIDTATGVLNSSGNGVFYFSNTQNTNTFFLTVKHRNSLETWSSAPFTFSSGTASYDFTTAANKAFGNNLKPSGSEFCIFGGDVNQDSYLTLHDLLDTYNASGSFATGYVKEDVNGDGFVNLNDITLVMNNASVFAATIKP